MIIKLLGLVTVQYHLLSALAHGQAICKMHYLTMTISLDTLIATVNAASEKCPERIQFFAISRKWDIFTKSIDILRYLLETVPKLFKIMFI